MPCYPTLVVDWEALIVSVLGLLIVNWAAPAKYILVLSFTLIWYVLDCVDLGVTPLKETTFIDPPTPFIWRGFPEQISVTPTAFWQSLPYVSMVRNKPDGTLTLNEIEILAIVFVVVIELLEMEISFCKSWRVVNLILANMF